MQLRCSMKHNYFILFSQIVLIDLWQRKIEKILINNKVEEADLKSKTKNGNSGIGKKYINNESRNLKIN